MLRMFWKKKNSFQDDKLPTENKSWQNLGFLNTHAYLNYPNSNLPHLNCMTVKAPYRRYPIQPQLSTYYYLSCTSSHLQVINICHFPCCASVLAPTVIFWEKLRSKKKKNPDTAFRIHYVMFTEQDQRQCNETLSTSNYRKRPWRGWYSEEAVRISISIRGKN